MIKKILLILFTIISIFLFYLIFYKNERSDSSAERITSSVQVPEKYLSGKELELYKLLVEELRKTAEGEDNSCNFFIEVPEPFESTDVFREALKKVNWFVKNYAPEYTFWADTTYTDVYSETECIITYFPSPEYAQDYGIELIAPEKLSAARDAIAYAKRIAAKYENESDYAKVIGYAAEICSLNTYNYEAADTKNYARENIDPWRIVSVFDGDPRTNVVCGGYAQAFEFLCGLGGIECHYVCGDIKDGGYHAWNIVVVNGVNYLVDLTTCDAIGYSADDIKRRHPYVMNAVTKSTPEYTETNLLTKDRSYYSVTYTYDDKTVEYLPADLLTVSEKPYRSKRELYFIMIGSLIGMVICAIPSKKRPREDEADGENENVT